MPEDLEVGITFNTDQAIQDLENDLEQADIQADVATQQQVNVGEGDGLGATSVIEGAGLAEAGSDIATGPNKGGLAGLAGGISKLAIGITALVGFLALLEPVQQALGFIARQFELFIVPFIAALQPVLELLQKAAVQLIQIFRNPGDFFSGLLSQIKKALAPFANSVIRGLNTIPGVSISTVSTGKGEARQTGFRSTGTQGDPVDEISRDVAARGGFNISNAGTTVTNYLLSDDATVEKLKSNLGGGDNIQE